MKESGEGRGFRLLRRRGKFTGDYTLDERANDQGKTIFIVAVPALIPPIKGVESISISRTGARSGSPSGREHDYHRRGYIAAEFAHFFEAMGTQVDRPAEQTARA
jgi:hypothetical protein